MGESTIEWTDATWNPVRGCALVSPGCANCYAMRQAHRFSGPGRAYEGLTVLRQHGPRWTGRARLVPEMLDQPLRWRRPRRVFVNSMSDLFHEDLTNEEIARVFFVMVGECSTVPTGVQVHTFQVLTKRPLRAADWFTWARSQVDHESPEVQAVALWARHQGTARNLWIGASVEDRLRKARIAELRRVPAAVRFLSLEPLLEDLGDLDLRGIHWVIVGGESGNGARRFDLSWARSIIEQCKAAGVPVFVKQLGAAPFLSARSTVRQFDGEVGGARVKMTFGSFDGEMSLTLRDRKGGDMAEWPADLRVREYPTLDAINP